MWGEVREDILGLLGVLNFLWAEDGRSRVESVQCRPRGKRAGFWSFWGQWFLKG